MIHFHAITARGVVHLCSTDGGQIIIPPQATPTHKAATP